MVTIRGRKLPTRTEEHRHEPRPDLPRTPKNNAIPLFWEMVLAFGVPLRCRSLTPPPAKGQDRMREPGRKALPGSTRLERSIDRR
jgi:hypothetical protein